MGARTSIIQTRSVPSVLLITKAKARSTNGSILKSNNPKENDMKNRFAVLFAVLALVASSLACAALSTELGLSNLRMAFDQDGQNLTSTYSPSDVFYAVADLSNAPQGTAVQAKWIRSEEKTSELH